MFGRCKRCNRDWSFNRNTLTCNHCDVSISFINPITANNNVINNITTSNNKACYNLHPLNPPSSYHHHHPRKQSKVEYNKIGKNTVCKSVTNSSSIKNLYDNNNPPNKVATNSNRIVYNRSNINTASTNSSQTPVSLPDRVFNVINKSCPYQSFSKHSQHPLPPQSLNSEPLAKLYLSAASKSKKSGMDETSMKLVNKMRNNSDIVQTSIVTTSTLGMNNNVYHNNDANNKSNKRSRDNLEDPQPASKKRKLSSNDFSLLNWTDIVAMGWKVGDEVEFVTEFYGLNGGEHVQIGTIFKLESDGYITIITNNGTSFDFYHLSDIKFNINRRRSPTSASSSSNNLEVTS